MRVESPVAAGPLPAYRQRMHRNRRAAIGGPLGTEGAVLSEYAVVVGVCGIVISFAILLMGTQLSTAYYQNRQIVIAPVP